jgi:hypothetical protein
MKAKYFSTAMLLSTAEAHVIVEAQTLNNTVDFVIWLITEQGIWHVQYKKMRKEKTEI